MKTISLTRNQVALVDDEWYDYLSQWKWYAFTRDRGKLFYAARTEGTKPHQKMIWMHKIIIGIDSVEIDHKNGNGLDNQKHNLRVCTHSQNMANRRKNTNSLSKYKGVYKHGNGWQTSLRYNKVCVFRKTFSTQEEAAHAYDLAASKYFGEFARLNFPLER